MLSFFRPNRLFSVLLFLFAGSVASAAEEGAHHVPSLIWTAPFVLILLCIAFFPLLPRLNQWWHHNSSKLIVSVSLGIVTCLYYFSRDFGFHHSSPGIQTVGSVVNHAILEDFVPFIVLLFSLFTISGGIRLTGDLAAHPSTNLAFILTGTAGASFIGTTGASMVLIRPLLETNKERKYVVHTVVFFIFLVSNIGGLLLPVGDPPLFLGYLRGVPFLWTLGLLSEWLICLVILSGLYYALDHYFYRKESPRDLRVDETKRENLRIHGKLNFVLLLGVILSVAILVPGRPLPGTDFVLPNLYFREIFQLILAGISLRVTPKWIREANHFNFEAIGEVAALFIGIFITMQVPIEILQIRGPSLGLDHPAEFFWATGVLSSFLDNAPTYVVFFETAGSLPTPPGELVEGVRTASSAIGERLLAAVSCGAVFMGANTYIGNAPNFLVKSIAEQRGIRMPSFFGYTLYSVLILLPVFALLTFLFFRS